MPESSRGASGDPTGGDLLAAVRQFSDLAQAWHRQEPEMSWESRTIAATALRLHAINFALWHHEDAVRRPGADDHEVARRKRTIDDLNARRNATVEDIDVTLLDRFPPNPTATLHTETPGTIVDRLSVLALRILHTDDRFGARHRLLEEQYDDLFCGLDRLLAGIRGGEVRFKLYRQFKAEGQGSYCALLETRHTEQR
ncbi:DUF4254 domain-containing protein [Mycobacterium seoulense]|uniref:DUF4254 domain-containing protein n=1 Tax=Mycobacterium seoulense TaxID=386911 RepID=UPI003CE71C60